MRFQSPSPFTCAVKGVYLDLEWGDRTKSGMWLSASVPGLPVITDIIESRRTALFGHVARLPACVPAHRALKIAVGARTGQPPSPSWKRPRGRPRDTWLKPYLRSGVSVWEHWDCALKKDNGPPLSWGVCVAYASEKANFYLLCHNTFRKATPSWVFVKLMLGIGLGLVLRPQSCGLGFGLEGPGLGLEDPDLGLGGPGLGLESDSNLRSNLVNITALLWLN